jgi:hypothetical protein
MDYGKRKNRSAFDVMWAHLGATVGNKPVRWPGFAKVLGVLSAETAELAGHACESAARIEAERAVVLGLVELIGRLDEGPARPCRPMKRPTGRNACAPWSSSSEGWVPGRRAPQVWYVVESS